MGAGASGLGNQTAKDLVKEMLNAIYANTSITQFMELSKRSSCSKFLFFYKESLAKHMKKFQLYPIKGQDGIISVISLEDILPGKAVTPESAKLLQQRDEFCVDVGYITTSALLIYFSLAINLFDDSPARSVLQSGGGISKTALGAKAGQIEKTMLSPFVGMYEVSIKGSNIVLSLKTPYILSFRLEEFFTNLDKDSIDVKADYDSQKRGGESEEKTLTFKREKGSGKIEQLITLYVDGDFVARFIKKTVYWYYTLEDTSASENLFTINDKKENDEFITALSESCGWSATNSSKPGNTTGPSKRGMTVPSGSSMYVGYDLGRETLKKVLDGNASYPIAYAVGRALTLMYPIDPKDRTSNQVITQVCNKSFNFEKSGAYLPREGMSINKNIYYGTLVGLFYDTYEVKGSGVEFKKSFGGEQALKEASSDLAALYEYNGGEAFIEKGSFQKHDMICTKKQGNLILPPPAVQALNSIVGELLNVHRGYKQRAMKIIESLFVIRTTKLPDKTAVTLDFSPALMNGGKDSINKVRVEARKLLLEYYLNSDSLFFKGVDIIRAYQNALVSV